MEKTCVSQQKPKYRALMSHFTWWLVRWTRRVIRTGFLSTHFTAPPVPFVTRDCGKFGICCRVCFFSPSSVFRGSRVFARGEGGLSFFALAGQCLPRVSQYPLVKPCGFTELISGLCPCLCSEDLPLQELRIRQGCVNARSTAGTDVCKTKSLLREVREVLRCLKIHRLEP